MANKTSNKRKRPPIIMVLEKVLVNSDRMHNGSPCWEWQGAVSSLGYGAFHYYEGDTRYAHRAAYMIFVGDVADGLVVDHACSNRRCVSPLHLQSITQKQNIINKYANKTHCVNGHEMDEANTRIRRDKKRGGEWRICRKCNRDSVRSWAKENPERAREIWQKQNKRRTEVG